MVEYWSPSALRFDRYWLILLVILVACPAPAPAFQAPGHITGSVSDETGAPLARVAITISGPSHRVAETGADGRFEVRGLSPGEYELTATLPGFATGRRQGVQILADARAVVDLTLSVAYQEHTLVTASKTGARTVQSMPASVSALSGEELRRSEAHSLGDLDGLAPSVTFSQNSDYAQLTIRGIGSTAVFAGSDPSSSVYLDGVYIARPVAVLTDFIDLERVEVLRGPQGTLYGRNTVGGAVNLITRSPTNETEASLHVTAGSLSTIRTEGRLSGPIVRDRLMGSIAFLRAARDGFVRDLDHPEEPLGGVDTTAALGKLQVILTRRSQLLLTADVSHKDATPLTYAKVLAVKPGFRVDNPPDLHEVRTSAITENRTLQYGASARATVQLPGGATLTSLTAFRKLDFDNRNDADITELELAAGHVREIQHQWSEELTISQHRSDLTWIAGVFLFDEVDRQPVSVVLGGPRLESRLDPDVQADSAAVFGQTSFRVMPRASLTAGLRYSRERKSIDNAGGLALLDPPFTAVPPSAYAYTDAISHTAWTPKIGLDVEVRPDTLAYVSAARGFKSGGFNLTSQAPGRGYAPEWAWSYEGGLKTNLARGGASLAVAAFQTDYTDLQVQTALFPGVIDISNAAAATIRGVELEGTTRLPLGMRAGGHLAWLDATYDRYTAVGVNGVTSETRDVSGHRLNNAPEWSGRMWLEWSRGAGPAGVLSVRAESRWQSTVYFTPFNDSVQRQRPYGVLDMQADVGPGNRRWAIGFWTRNLSNVDYITGAFSSPPPAIGGRPAEPRQAGVRLTLSR